MKLTDGLLTTVKHTSALTRVFTCNKYTVSPFLPQFTGHYTTFKSGHPTD